MDDVLIFPVLKGVAVAIFLASIKIPTLSTRWLVGMLTLNVIATY